MIDLLKIRQMINGPSEDQRYLAFMELYQDTSPEGIEELNRICNLKDPILKLLFIRFLGNIEEERAVVLLRNFLLDDNPVVVDAAKRNFEKNPFSNKLYSLLPVVYSPIAQAQYFAIEKLAIGSVGECLDSLLDLLSHANEELLLKLLSALRYFPVRKILPYIKPYLSDTRNDVRFKSILIIAAIHERKERNLRKILYQACKDPFYEIRKVAFWALRKNPHKSDISHIIFASLNDPEETVRQEALLGLISFPGKESIEHLLYVLTHETKRQVSLKAESVLLSMPIKILIKNLQSLIHKKNEKIRLKAILIFAEFRKKSDDFFKFLVEELKRSKDEKNKLIYIEAIGITENPKAVPILIPYITQSKFLAYTAINALLKVDRKCQDHTLIDLLDKDEVSPILRQIILRHLVLLDLPHPSEKLLFQLNQLLHSENVNLRYLTAQVLIKYKTEAIYTSLFKQLIQEEDPTIKKLLESNLSVYLFTHMDFLIKLLLDYRTDLHALPFLFAMLSQSKLNKEHLYVLLQLLIRTLQNSPEDDKLKNHIEKVLASFVMEDKVDIYALFQLIDDLNLKLQLLHRIEEESQSHMNINERIKLSDLEILFHEFPLDGQLTILNLIQHFREKKFIPFLSKELVSQNNEPLVHKISTVLNHLVWSTP